MHHAGHSRAHSMHTVQFSSINAITPRERGGSSGSASGYCAVTARLVMFRQVTASPLARPLPGRLTVSSLCHSLRHHHSYCRDRELEEHQGNQTLPGDPLQLVLTETWVGHPDPHHEKRDEERLGQCPDPADLVLERPVPATEEEHRRQRGEHHDAGVLREDEQREPQAAVLRLSL